VCVDAVNGGAACLEEHYCLMNPRGCSGASVHPRWDFVCAAARDEGSRLQSLLDGWWR
jgi:hypothetical protein